MDFVLFLNDFHFLYQIDNENEEKNKQTKEKTVALFLSCLIISEKWSELY